MNQVSFGRIYTGPPFKTRFVSRRTTSKFLKVQSLKSPVKGIGKPVLRIYIKTGCEYNS